LRNLLELEKLSPGQREGVTHILKGGRHLLALINEVLDIARIESGRLSLSPEAVRVSEVLQETLDLVKPLAAQTNVQLIAHEADAGARYVLADRQRLKQVLLNLLSNALKYNRPGGSVTLICTEIHDHASAAENAATAKPARLRLAVKDTGQGIAKDRLERLFSPFDRLGAENGSVEGTGLGLALSKRLVDAMGGRMGMESVVGEGSLFWVELNLTEEAAEEQPGLSEPQHAKASPPTAARRTVLYIEDNLSNLKLIEQIFTHRPAVQLQSAMQGALGINFACEHRPALILLDLNLPDMEGSEVMARLRSDPRTSAIPVVVISADAMQTQIERLLAAGARAYLTKPIDVTKFLAVLDEALKQTAPRLAA